MTHSFSVEDADRFGVNAAIILNLLRGWVAHNKANGKNERDGRTWTYNSVRAWAKLVPYLSAKQVRTAIDDLIEAGAIVKANFNENPHDRTLWYSVADICPTGQIAEPLPPGANGDAAEGNCVEHRDTKEEPISSEESGKPEETELTLEAGRFVEWFIELLGQTGAPPTRLTPSIRKGWADAYEKLRRIDGKSKDEIVKVCRWARADPFWSGNFYAPTKLRERKDGVSRYDLFLSRISTSPNNGHPKTQQPNGRSFSQGADVDYDAIADRIQEQRMRAVQGR